MTAKMTNEILFIPVFGALGAFPVGVFKLLLDRSHDFLAE
jgi:hypothetical protein